MKDIIVFSHLRWNFVYQRPQHLLSRLARHHRILFVEEPISGGKKEGFSLKTVDKNIIVVQPHGTSTNFVQWFTPHLQQLAKKHLFHMPVLWFYSPANSDILECIDHSLVVYDCMDELTKFKFASSQLASQEVYLLSHADIVFTGGKSLYEAKKKLHPHVHCFPSSVDKKHFMQAMSDRLPIPKDIRTIAAPIVGYYGVIDERIDIDLLEYCAERMPDVSFLMIGPVVKIDEEHLPKRNNIYYLGMKSYKELPKYLKAIDIAMMPFARNESTEFISPTKTLEFIAAGKPVVATPIRDVVRDYARVVSVAESSETFVAAIQQLLQDDPASSRKRYVEQQRILRKTSWDITVAAMDTLIIAAVSEKKQTAALELSGLTFDFALFRPSVSN